MFNLYWIQSCCLYLRGAKILLAADRFYGTHSLISWCQKQDLQYQIRLRSNLILEHKGGELTTGEAASMNLTSLKNAGFNNTTIKTNIEILQEEGYKEPWIIAMDCLPSKYKVLDYDMRWGN